LQVAQTGAFWHLTDMSDKSSPEPETWKKLRTLARQVLAVPKTEIDRRDAEWRKAKAMKRSAKK